MAGTFNSAAVSARASGREAPSRKENADRECNSTYMAQSYIPSTNQLRVLRSKYAIERSVTIKREIYIPLLSFPFARGIPPIATVAPWTGRMKHTTFPTQE